LGESIAKIAGNTISGHEYFGVLVKAQSHTVISGNNIGNNGNGIYDDQSTVSLSTDPARRLF